MISELNEMSFQNKSFWMPKDAACLTDGELGYDTPSKVEPKHTHNWFADVSEQDSVSNKRQAIETANSKPMPGFSNVNFSLWDNASSFQSVSGQFMNRLFGPESARDFGVAGNTISSVGEGNMLMGRKDSDHVFENNMAVNLSISHSMEDPLSSNQEIGKMKLNKVRDQCNVVSSPLNLSQTIDEGTMSMHGTYGKNNSGSVVRPTYSDGDGSSLSICPTLNKVEENFMSMNHTISKEDGNFMLMGHNYSRQDDGILSIGRPFVKGASSFISMDQRYEKGDGNCMSMGSPLKVHESFISMGLPYNKDMGGFVSIGNSYEKHDNSTSSVGPTLETAAPSSVSMSTTYVKEDSIILSRYPSYNAGKSNTISFGGIQDDTVTDHSGSLISSYDLMIHQNLIQGSKEPRYKEMESNSDPLAAVASPTSRADTVPRQKEQKGQKKIAPNNFPSNVKSLLSTGILDGVPVKYVSWSREKNLKGMIRGTGYLCGCNECKNSKALNAYEFERHAGCKTKHPNNHIYFENGKTIYAVVQELKSTPQEMLFEAIQTVTGSAVNEKNFRIWKASYQAATRELQRIYGKEEVVMPS